MSALIVILNKSGKVRNVSILIFNILIVLIDLSEKRLISILFLLDIPWFSDKLG